MDDVTISGMKKNITFSSNHSKMKKKSMDFNVTEQGKLLGFISGSALQLLL